MPFVSFLNLAFTIDVCPCLEAPRPSPWDHPNLDMYFRPKFSRFSSSFQKPSPFREPCLLRVDFNRLFRLLRALLSNLIVG